MKWAFLCEIQHILIWKKCMEPLLAMDQVQADLPPRVWAQEVNNFNGSYDFRSKVKSSPNITCVQLLSFIEFENIILMTFLLVTVKDTMFLKTYLIISTICVSPKQIVASLQVM